MLLGHGIFLPPDVCRALVADVQARSGWRHYDSNEAAGGAEAPGCRMSWRRLPPVQRRLVLDRIAEIARALGGGSGPAPRCGAPFVCRFGPGDFHQRHVDPPGGDDGRRPVSFAAFLTGCEEPGSFTGGELHFYPTGRDRAETCIQVSPRIGHFVVFSPGIEHEVRPVLSGQRLSLISSFYLPTSNAADGLSNGLARAGMEALA